MASITAPLFAEDNDERAIFMFSVLVSLVLAKNAVSPRDKRLQKPTTCGTLRGAIDPGSGAEYW